MTPAARWAPIRLTLWQRIRNRIALWRMIRKYNNGDFRQPF